MNTQREMFEVWVIKSGTFKKEDLKHDKKDGEKYFYMSVQLLWDAWQAAVAAQKNKLSWQPVSSPPNKFEEVMVWPHPSDWRMVAEYDGSKWCYTEYEHNWGVNHITCFPTHWMPLPQEPNNDTL